MDPPLAMPDSQLPDSQIPSSQLPDSQMPDSEYDLPETQLASQSQHSSEPASLSTPDPAEVARSWGYLRPFRPDLPCVYFHLGKEKWIIGRENVPINFGLNGNARDRDKLEPNDVCIGVKKRVKVLKEFERREFDENRGGFVKRKEIREVEELVEEGKKIS